MEKAGLKIDWDGRNYASCTEDESIACIATGKTLNELKSSLLDALRQHIEWMREDGDIVPREFTGLWEPEWHHKDTSPLFGIVHHAQGTGI